MMRRGHSDTAIDFYPSAYCREILDAAHPTRFSRERITYGSDIFDGFRGDIWPSNTNDEIGEGRRLVRGSRIPLARLNEGARPYGRLIDNMLRPFGRRGRKDHFLTTYPDDKPVAFTIFDFDRHPPKGPSGPPSTEDDGLSAKDAYDAWIAEVSKLAATLDGLTLDEIERGIANTILTDVSPRVIEYRNEMKSVRDRLWGDLIKKVATWQMPSLAIVSVMGMGYDQALMLFAAAIAPTVPPLVDYFRDKRATERNHAISYLIGLSPGDGSDT